VSRTQARGKRLVVFPQFGKHVRRLDVLRIIVQQTLHTGDMTDRFECRPADLSNALFHRVGHCKNLVSLRIFSTLLLIGTLPSLVNRVFKSGTEYPAMFNSLGRSS
jgi:hypothetical protein